MKNNKVAVVFVSGDIDLEDSRRDLEFFAKEMGLDLVEMFPFNSASGSQEWNRLEAFLSRCIDAGLAYVLVPDFSYLGRTVKEIRKTVDRFINSQVNIHILDLGLFVFDQDGDPNPRLDEIYSLLECGCRIEGNRRRIRVRKKGENRGGRNPGSVKGRKQYEREYAEVIEMLREGKSIRASARETGFSVHTVKKLSDMFVKEDD